MTHIGRFAASIIKITFLALPVQSLYNIVKILSNTIYADERRRWDALQKREAALTHVSIREKKLGWRHITVEEAATLYEGQTVPASEHVFMCELCGQYVIFANPDKGERYFMHSRGEEDKNCEERTLRSKKYPTPQAGCYLLPLKIVLNSSWQSFSLYIGVPRIGKYETDARVIVVGEELRPHSFLLSERTNDVGITWLNLGQDISLQYTVQTKGFQARNWPEQVPGINPDGAVFDSVGGKMLCPGDEVVEKHWYYLLTDSIPPYCGDISCTKFAQKTIHGKIWDVYKIKATAFSPDTVRYFLLLHMRLVKSAVSLSLLWPPTVKVQGTAFHDGDTLYVAHNGGVDLQLSVFPLGQKLPQQRNEYFCVESNDFQQMAAVRYDDGQQNQGSHIMLWQGRITENIKEPDVKVSDGKRVLLTESTYTKLPAQKLLRILAPYDGKIIIEHGDKVCDIQAIKSEELKTLEVSFGETIKIFQGNDVAKTISFKRPEQKPNEPFAARLLQLLHQPTRNYTSVKHTMGNMILRIPMTAELKRELYVCVRNGKMPTEAYRYITDYLANRK